MNEELILDSLSPIERKILPYLELGNLKEIAKVSGLDNTSILRGLEFLKKKKLVEISKEEKTVINLGINGIFYLKKQLPERRLLTVLDEKKKIPFGEIKNSCKLNDNEVKVAVGILKKKLFVEILEGKVILNADKSEIHKKFLEEIFLEKLPISLEDLKPEDKLALESLKQRKELVSVENKKEIFIKATKEGERISKLKLNDDLIEQLTPKMIKTRSYKGKKFRRYDIHSQAPKLVGGKRHFVNQATDYAKRIWTDMGFKEMSGNYVQSGFWVFDALFTAQDHPVREMQDTFFLKNKLAKLPEKDFVKGVKDAHEGKIDGSKGWQQEWNEEDARKVLLRTHTTPLSIKKLREISKNKEFPAKYFALGKCFRNETVDWSHGFEFNQTEGIVVDENANFTQLLGYLKQFFKKMGYEKIRIRPAYFAYTEPSLEIDVFHPVHKEWVELGGAGMFRPEVTIPIFGKHIPVLAWGPGFDRIIMEYFKVTDLREMYKNDLTKSRSMKVWNR